MIEIKNLCFSYGNNEFIRDLNVAFPDSSLTVIVGENGSGKTTLLSLIANELKFKSGTMQIDGIDIGSLKHNELACRLSVFPQGREIPDMTALELVSMGRYPHNKSKITTPKRDIDIAYAALARVGTEKFAERRLSSLSYGERQRIYLAMQIAQDAQNLLLDEPTNYLDISARFQTMELLTSLKNEGKCVVAVLHDITLALAYADRIAVMKNGELVDFDTPDMIYQRKSLEDTFGVRISRFDRNGKPLYVTEPK